METNYTQELKYKRAQKRVKKIKGFYVHLTVYIFVNLLISGFNLYRYLEEGYELIDALNQFDVYSTAVFWGIGLFLNWMSVFGFRTFLSNDWEERKIKEYMDRS